MKNAQSFYKLNRRNVVGMLTVDVQNTWKGIETSFLHYERKEMDRSPLEMMIHPKSLEKAQSELGKKNEKVENVLLVEYMKHNLLSVIQMCDQDL